MEGYPTSGSFTITMTPGKQVRLVRLPTGYGYVFGASGFVYSGESSVSGHWEGPWENSRGESAPLVTLDITEGSGGTITGLWDKEVIKNGRRSGNVITWKFTAAERKYQCRFVISTDGKSGILKYTVWDPAREPHSYSGTHRVTKK